MPADLTDLLENVSSPPMHVDAETVLTRGRRRRLHRRLYGTAVVLAAAALVAPVAVALRADPALPAVPAVSPPVDCASAGQAPNPTGLWLDSGPATATRTLRVRVYHDTCQGLSVAVARGSASSVSMADVAGQPPDAFWVVEANGGGLDKFGKALPVKTTAVALLPNGQRVCGIGPAPGAGAPQGQMPSPERANQHGSRRRLAGNVRRHLRHWRPAAHCSSQNLRRWPRRRAQPPPP